MENRACDGNKFWRGKCVRDLIFWVKRETFVILIKRRKSSLLGKQEMAWFWWFCDFDMHYTYHMAVPGTTCIHAFLDPGSWLSLWLFCRSKSVIAMFCSRSCYTSVFMSWVLIFVLAHDILRYSWVEPVMIWDFIRPEHIAKANAWRPDSHSCSCMSFHEIL